MTPVRKLSVAAVSRLIIRIEMVLALQAIRLKLRFPGAAPVYLAASRVAFRAALLAFNFGVLIEILPRPILKPRIFGTP